MKEEYKNITNKTIKEIIDLNLNRVVIEIDGDLYDYYIENRKIKVDGRLKNVLIIGK